MELLAGHPDLAPELAAFFAGHDRFSRLAAPLRDAVSAVQESTIEDKLAEGGRLGDFHLLREIGRGGMGVVYEAEQISLGRRVALKVLPFAAALDSKQLQRFKNEAHAAANLQHQNIVPVYAVGCERGVHFYAMQFIEGQTLATLIRELRQLKESEDRRSKIEDRGSNAEKALGAGLPTPSKGPTAGLLEPTGPYAREGNKGAIFRDREKEASTTIEDQAAGTETLPAQPRSSILDSRSSPFFRTVANLGIQAAEALEHAHQLGVIHRDIKPANMMVENSPLTTHHSPLRLWITDFGLAHCQGAVELTMSGDLLGTLRYMSPEQALSQRALVDQRTDIYSLGVTLYELLTLEPAFPSTDRQELLRQIASDEPRPPRRFNKAIPPELETIVLKAMEKEPAHRYPTAQEFGADLRRFLEDKPILAKRPTWMQRTRKWVRRHQSAVWAAGVAGVILVAMAVGGLAISNVFIDQERRQAVKQRDLAEASFRQACQAVEEQLTLVSQSTLFETPGSQHLRKDLLEAALKSYQSLLAQRPDDPLLRADIAATYFRLYQMYQMTGPAGFSVDVIGALDKGLQTLENLLHDYPSEHQLYSRLAGFAQGGRFFHDVSRDPPDPVTAIRLHVQAAQIWEKFVQDDPTEIGFQMDLAAFYLALSNLPATPTEKLQSAIKAHQLRAKVARDNPTVPEYRAELAESHDLVGLRLRDTGQVEEAEKHYRQALVIREKLTTECPTVVKYREALATSHHNLGSLLWSTGRRQEAERAYRLALATQKKLASEYPRVPVLQGELAHFHLSLANMLELDRHEEIEQACGAALDIYDKLVAEFPTVSEYRYQRVAVELKLADIYFATDRPEEAVEHCQKQIVHLERLVAEFPREAGFRYSLVHCYLDLGNMLGPDRPKEIEQAYLRAADNCHQLVTEFPTVAEHTRRAAEVDIKLGDFYLSADRRADAVQHYHKVIVLLEQQVAQSREAGFRHSLALGNLGLCRALAPDQPKEAEQACAQALEIYQQLVAEFPALPEYRHGVAEVHMNLGDLYISTKRRAEAVEQHQKAIVLLRQLAGETRQHGFRHSLAHCCKQMGWLNLTAVPPEERPEDYMQAISIYEELRKEYPNDTSSKLELGKCWDELGELRRRNGWFEPAEEAYRRAVGIFQQVLDESPRKYEHNYLLARSQNNLAWILCTRPDWGPQHAAEALEHAKKAVDLEPEKDDFWHTLGAAQCRMGHWKEALAAIEKSRQLEQKTPGYKPGPPSSFDLFFEAMAYNGLGEREKARRCYDEGVQWMEKHIPDHADLRRFKAEAAAMLKIQEEKNHHKDTNDTKKMEDRE